MIRILLRDPARQQLEETFQNTTPRAARKNTAHFYRGCMTYGGAGRVGTSRRGAGARVPGSRERIGARAVLAVAKSGSVTARAV